MLGQNDTEVQSILKEIKPEVPLDDKILIMQRDTKDLLEMEYLPSIGFQEKEKEEILAEVSKVTDLGITSWTHEAQRANLTNALAALQIENDVLKAALEDKDIKSIILDMILFSKYILTYRKPSSSQEYELYYISQFKDRIRLLMAKAANFQDLIKAIAEAGGLFRIIVLAYAEIVEHDKLLLEFRASELVGHNVAYQVAKNENKFEHLKIINEKGRVLEEYDIREIRVMKDGKRNRGLKGIILISKNIQTEVLPTLYISWAGTHGGESLNADLERTPGEESFRQGEDQIIQQVLNAILEIGKPVKVMICGHSLGGALSQLLFHSMQRVLAFQIKDEDVQQKVSELEAQFHEALLKFTPHQTYLNDITLDMNLISEMRVDVWNSAGVLAPVVDHSNELSAILTKTGVLQHASFGFVDGDVLQSIGQGNILSKAHENGVKIKVMRVESSTTRTFMAALGASAAYPAGLALVGVTPMGWLASTFCAGAMLAEIFSNTRGAHTKHHFKVGGARPMQGYSIFSSHKEDGSLNSDECKKIQENLTLRSTSIIDAGLHMISQAFMYEDRFKSEFANAVLLDKKNGQHDKTLQFIIARILTGNTVEEGRVIKLLNDKELEGIIGLADEKGKTILHHAIENANYQLVNALLSHERIDVHQMDQEGNFPLLTFMQKVNGVLYQSVETYNLGIKLLGMTQTDLAQKNKSGVSVESIYHSWYWSGYNARTFMAELARRIALVSVVPEASEVVVAEQNVMLADELTALPSPKMVI